ncbi:MAG: hypothetical protein ACRDJC_01930, partial [Thermomicrobiales bacterium]
IGDGLALAEELGDPALVGEALTYAAFLSYRRGNYRRAEERFAMGDRLLREQAPSASEAQAPFGHWFLGDVALAQGKFSQAAGRYETALGPLREARSAYGLSDAQAGLAGAHLCAGDVARAAALYTESLDRAQNLKFTQLAASSLFGLAGMAAAIGRPEAGARLLGAAEGITDSLAGSIFPRDLPIRDRALAALRTALGEERLATARAEGRALSVKQAVAEASEVAAAGSTVGTPCPEHRTLADD